MDRLPLSDWMDALIAAADELATETLGMEEGSVFATETSLVPVVSGAFIALVSPERGVEVGICASAENCVKLAGAFLGLDPAEDELSPGDLDDALGEIVNVVAGMLKTRMADRVPDLKIGLPIVLHGRIGRGSGTEMIVAWTRWGDAEAALVLVRSANGDSVEQHTSPP